MTKRTMPYGDWPSPLSAASVAEGGLRFGRVQAADGAVFWSESRPAEKGRAPILRWDGSVRELLPAPYSARSRVHEYGGGEFLVANGRVFFVNDADQDVYETSARAGTPIRRLTRLPNTRFADFACDLSRERLICVGETHDPGHADAPENALWTVPTGGDHLVSGPSRLISGRDFYASPRLSPDGTRLAFLAWDLPAMPWDAAALFVCAVGKDGTAGEAIAIAGGAGSACFQPEWSEDGSLYFIWDGDGWGNLFRWREGEEIEQITHLDAEISKPLWSLNAVSYALFPDGRIYLNFVERGESRLAILDQRTGKMERRAENLTATFTLSADGAGAALAATADDEPLSIVLDQGSAPVLLRRSSTLRLDAGFVSIPRQVEIAGTRGPIFGLLYGPQNKDAEGPARKAPPLIINLHGGPTSAATRGLKPNVLFFTSRGFAWLDLNYSGSVGYGRDYRLRLNGNWGVADVEDAIAAADYAASSGIADRDGIFVTGGSAGGYTVLTAIASTKVFAGAASYYGISDLIALQRTTHKFEQGYQSSLLGASLEENEAVYRERSALYRAERIGTPLILFQGAEDRVVPREQSVAIAEALRANGVTVEYHEFEGEGHGFRKAETIRTCLERELDFYKRLLARSSLS
jgi:dipeptidyl aminopeptidase/acylaminoacyl peptidase